MKNKNVLWIFGILAAACAPDSRHEPEDEEELGVAEEDVRELLDHGELVDGSEVLAGTSRA